jgi:hypothetical protein
VGRAPGLSVTASLAKESVTFAPARATADALLRELSKRVVTHECLERAEFWVARRRACPRVPASPKMYPSRTREASKIRRRRQHYMPIYRAFGQAL